jgi:hypothetical protein
MIFGLITFTGFTSTVTCLGIDTLRALGTSLITATAGLPVMGATAGAGLLPSVGLAGAGRVSATGIDIKANSLRRRHTRFSCPAFVNKGRQHNKKIPATICKIIILVMIIYYKQVLQPCVKPVYLSITLN